MVIGCLITYTLRAGLTLPTLYGFGRGSLNGPYKTPTDFSAKGRSMNDIIERWRQRARRLKKETYALHLASKDPRVPWYAKLLAVSVVGYLFSPIDLIPDFIPVLGYVDDLVLVPLGIALVLKMIPGAVMAECREKPRSSWPRGNRRTGSLRA